MNPYGLQLPPDHVLQRKRWHYRLDNNTECFRLDGSDIFGLEGNAVIHLVQGQQYVEKGINFNWKAKTLYATHFDERIGYMSEYFYPFPKLEKRDETSSIVQVFYGFPHGPYMRVIGEHVVTYRILTPWLSSHTPYVLLSRKIIVRDIDECSYIGDVVEYQAHCVDIAPCRNVPGSYDCICPSGYKGNGREINVGGTGCHDNRAPVLLCQGIGCSTIRLFSLNYSGVVWLSKAKELAGCLPFEINPSPEVEVHYLLTFLEQNKCELCDIHNNSSNQCFLAYDLVPPFANRSAHPSAAMNQMKIFSFLHKLPTDDVVVPLTHHIHMGHVEFVESKINAWVFRIPCSVQDYAG